ncbi:hypothetical protein N0V82_010854, partial [Gnomoniopsis sp. IMI 355080]
MVLAPRLQGNPQGIWEMVSHDSWDDGNDSEEDALESALDRQRASPEPPVVSEETILKYIDGLQRYEWGQLPQKLRQRFTVAFQENVPFTNGSEVIITCGDCGFVTLVED